ncbi:hypothetical protein Tco_0969292 [Tanacetum coccineum]
MPGLEEPQSPPPLDFVPEPMYTKYMPLEDKILPEDPSDYPADRDDDDDEEEVGAIRRSCDDKDEERDIEEEHPSCDSVPTYTPYDSQISIRMSNLYHFLLGRASPPASVLPASPPASPIRPVMAINCYESGLRARPHLLPIHYHYYHPSNVSPRQEPVAPSSGTPPLHLLSTDRREDRPKVCLPPRKRLCSTQGPRYEIGESSSAASARPIGGRRADYRTGRPDISRLNHWLMRSVPLRDCTPTRSGGSSFSEGMWTAPIRIAKACQNDYSITLCRPQEQREIEKKPKLQTSMTVPDRKQLFEELDIVAKSTTGTGDHFTGIGDITAGNPLEVPAQPLHRRRPKMAPKRTTRARPAPETTTTTTSVTNAQLQAMINQGVVVALAPSYAALGRAMTANFGKLVSGGLERETVFRISTASGITDQVFHLYSSRRYLRKKMIDKYCPRNEMKKLDVELMEFKGESTDSAGSGDKKSYTGSKPLCPKCNYNHNGPCAPKCYKCNKFGHLGRNLKVQQVLIPGSQPKRKWYSQRAYLPFECGIRDTSRQTVRSRKQQQATVGKSGLEMPMLQQRCMQ